MATMAEHTGRRTRRSATEDFKAGVVRLVLDRQHSRGRSTRSGPHGVVAPQPGRAGPRGRCKTGLTTAEREELSRLRKDVRELSVGRDVPRDATVR